MPAEGDAATRRLGYQPALDGIRALAIVPVVAFHAFGWPEGGVLGVHMFFVLSGFLITTLLLQEWNRNGSISLRHFYFRRGLRLFPALAVMLGAYVLIQVARELVIEPEALNLRAALEGVLYSVFYVSNVVQAFSGILAVPLIPLWSLATEEQFYLLWPFLLLAALRLRLRQRIVAGSLLLAIGLIVAHRVRLSLSDFSVERLYFSPDTSFDTILIGCLLGLWFVTERGPSLLRSASFLRWAWIPAALLVVGTVLVTSNESPAMYWAFLLPFSIAVAILILSVVADSDSLLGRCLGWAPLVFLGRISYSLYLWNLMVIYFGSRVGVPAIVGVAASVAVAIASYYLVEQPFLRRKRRDRAEVDGTTVASPRNVSPEARRARLSRPEPST